MFRQRCKVDGIRIDIFEDSRASIVDNVGSESKHYLIRSLALGIVLYGDAHIKPLLVESLKIYSNGPKICSSNVLGQLCHQADDFLLILRSSSETDAFVNSNFTEFAVTFLFAVKPMWRLPSKHMKAHLAVSDPVFLGLIERFSHGERALASEIIDYCKQYIG